MLQLKEFFDTIFEFLKPYVIYISGGSMGAIMRVFRFKMSFKEIIGSVIISIFVGFSFGILAEEYFKIDKPEVIYIICSISGTFSKIILDELEEIIKGLSDFVRSYLDTKFKIKK